MASYPNRSLLQEEALSIVPTIAVLAARERLDVRALNGNVQVLSKRGDFVVLLTPGDWEKVDKILSRPDIVSSLGRIRGGNDPHFGDISQYKAILDSLVKQEFPPIGG